MSLTVVSLLCSVLCLVQAQNDSLVLSCPSAFRDVVSNRTIDITEWCHKKQCITKCCPANKVIFKDYGIDSNACVDSSTLTQSFNILTDLDDYSDVEIFDTNIKRNIIKSNTRMEQLTRIYSDNFIYTQSCLTLDVPMVFPTPANKIYILENGSLIVRRANYFNQWLAELSPGLFCVEHQLVRDADGNVSSSHELVIKMIVEFGKNDSSHNRKNTLIAYGMLVSSFFLALVLAVYALLPQLRNLAGMMLMAYVATLTTAFIFRAVQVLAADNGQLDWTACIYIVFTLYYTTLASFTWMNVISFDIWWSMRGFRKLLQIHREGTLVKFGWYSLYGWGAPLVPLLLMLIVDHLDLTHLPNFVKPHFMEECFMPEEERRLYMNGPILITTGVNIMLFLMTAYNIWRVKSGIAHHSAGDSRRNIDDETRFGIYLKLSLVMGINWILEVVDSLYQTDSAWWYIPDVFNSLFGLFIFIIFVCKMNIIVLLCKRFSIGSGFVQKLQSVDSSRTGHAME